MHRHGVFISYHDGRSESPTAGDWRYRELFEKLFHDTTRVLISRAVRDGDIDPNLHPDTVRQRIRDEYLRDSSVTIVLVGARTWQRSHVDWEIGSSIRNTDFNPRSGLLGILLPSYPGFGVTVDESTILPRLFDNVKCGFAKLYWWTENPLLLNEWIHEAYVRKDQVLPDNSRTPFVRNRSGTHWSD